MTEGIDVPDDEVVRDVMREFLRSGITGCGFAAQFAKERKHIEWNVLGGVRFPESLAERLSAFFDSAAGLERAGIVVFPDLRTADEIVHVIERLAGKPRWRVQQMQWREHERSDFLLALWWRTPKNDETSMQGFAPLGSMPVFRRSPFVAMAAWPGDKLNPLKKSQDRAGRVGFADMPPLYPQKHDDTWTTTETRVALRSQRPLEGAARPMVSFCLPTECTTRLRALPGINNATTG